MNFRFHFLSGCVLFAAAALLAAAEPSDVILPADPFSPPNFPKPVFAERTFNVRDHGAKGDGRTNDTQAFNAAMLACNKAGGGTVFFPAGDYLVASARIQSNVRVLLDDKATIIGGPDGEFLPPEPNPGGHDPKSGKGYQDFGHTHFHNGIMWGENIENFAFTGGTINTGAIIKGDPKPGGGDKVFAIKVGRNLLFEKTTVTRGDKKGVRGGHFVWLLNDCENITLADVVVFGSRDAADFMGCRNVQMHGCHFTDCSDDTVGIKSDWALGRRITSRNFYIWNCYFETRCNPIQFGSETAGDFYNINCWDITVGRTEKAVFGITSMDSGVIDGVRAKNFRAKNVTTPVFMMITDRMRTGEKLADPKLKPGIIRNVVLSDFVIENSRLSTPTTLSPEAQVFPITISGLPDFKIENITLENFKISYLGGGTEADAAIENLPYVKTFRPSILKQRPAAAMYIRHAKNITLRNFEVVYENPDKRPPFVLRDVDGLVIENFKMPKTDASYLMRIDSAKNVELRNSLGLPDRKIAEAENEKL